MSDFSMPRLTPVGHLGKPHGVRGEITAFLTVAPEHLRHDDTHPVYLFAETDGLPVPYRLFSCREKGDAHLLSLSGVSNRTQAERLTNRPLFLPADDLAGDDLEFTWGHFAGYTVVDQTDTPVGTVLRVEDQTDNILFAVSCSDGSTRLLPVHEQLVRYLSHEDRMIGLTIPDGLMDL